MMMLVKDYAEQIRGVSYKPEDVCEELNDESITLLRANNITDSGLCFDDLVYVRRNKVKDVQKLQKGDILICTSSGSKALVGKAAYVTKDMDMTFGAFCKVIRPHGVNTDYFQYFFQSPAYRKKISELAAGANINNIRNEHIDGLAFYLPDLPTQQRIADTLDKVSEGIEVCRRMLDELELMVKAKFGEMFGDMLLNSKHWSECTLESLADIVSGITKGRKTKDENLIEVPYMAVSNVKDGHIDWRTVKTIMATTQEINQYRLQSDDVLMTEGGDPDKVGRGAIIKNPPENCIHQNHIFRVRLNEKVILPTFFAEYLQHQKAKRYFLGCAKQTTGIASINMRQLKAMPVLLPPIELQEQFATFVSKTDKSRLTIQQVLSKMEMVKLALMHEYFG